MIAFLPSLWTRLLGISLASFSSGLGELTFLQLSTRYGRSGAGRSVGWFSSGTGAAGLVGAMAWWIVRPLGVKVGLCILSFLPLLLGIGYAIVLPTVEAVQEESGLAKGTYEQVRGEESDWQDSSHVKLTLQDKIRLIKPMLTVYILPLVLVYFFE
jgi:battenin